MMRYEPSKRILLRRQEQLKREADNIARRLSTERNIDADNAKAAKRTADAELRKRWLKLLEEIESINSLIEALPERRLNLLAIAGLALAVLVLLVGLILKEPLGHVWARIEATTNFVTITIAASEAPIPIISELRLQADGFRVDDGPMELLGLDTSAQGKQVVLERVVLFQDRESQNSRASLSREQDGWLVVELYGSHAEITITVAEEKTRRLEATAPHPDMPVIAFRLKLAEAWEWPQIDWITLTTVQITGAGLTDKKSLSGLLEGMLHIDESDRTASIFPRSFLQVAFGERSNPIDWLLRLGIAGMQPEREWNDRSFSMERNSLEVRPSEPIMISIGNTITQLTLDRRELIPTRLAYLYAGDRLLFLISLLTGIAAVLLLLRQIARGKLG